MGQVGFNELICVQGLAGLVKKKICPISDEACKVVDSLVLLPGPRLCVLEIHEKPIGLSQLRTALALNAHIGESDLANCNERLSGVDFGAGGRLCLMASVEWSSDAARIEPFIDF